MTNRNRNAVVLSALLVALPLVSLTLAAVAWLRYGMDMPWFDDWRGYADGSMRSLALSHLFSPMNDTLSPVGLALDAMAQRYLDGNSVAYQFISMVLLLSALLILQWNLLRRALGDTLQSAVCFSLTVLMLQPGSYWGLENVAYYQALPAVFILLALWLASSRSAAIAAWRGPAFALLGLLAGFTYISGAFAAVAAGVSLMAVAAVCYSGEPRRALMRDASWFTAVSAIAAAVQFYFSVLNFRGMAGVIPIAFPAESAFWAFYLGKLARSLLLPAQWPRTSLALTLAACAVSVTAAYLLARRAARPDSTEEERRMAALCLPLAAVVFVYLMLVAAGRTNFRPAEMQRLPDVFRLGFTRFHFFWATLIWPWVAAALIMLCRRTKFFSSGSFRRGAIAYVAVLAVLVFAGGGYDHMARQHELAVAREPIAHCLLNELQRGGAVRCKGLLPPRGNDSAPDAYPAYAYARKTGASFVRYFPLLPAAKRREGIAAFFRMDGSTATPRTHDVESLGKGRFRSLGNDPQLFIQTAQPQDTRRCIALDVEIEMKVAAIDTAQLFFAPSGDSVEYEEANSVRAPVGVDSESFQTISFRLVSDAGFFESMRFDPVTKPQTFEIREVRMYCVWELL
jgi:hypothetical protein